MAENRKIGRARFAYPVWVNGLGMTQELDLTDDADSGKSKAPGVLMTWLSDERLMRVTVAGFGETLVTVPCSMRPVYEDRLVAKTAKK